MSNFILNREYKRVTKIQEGCSSDKKYYLETHDGLKYLLRISDSSEYHVKKDEYNKLKDIAAFDVPLSKPVDFGYCDDGKSVFTLLEWIEGTDVEKSIEGLSRTDRYILGVKAGNILKEIHKSIPNEIMDDWSTRYNSVIEPRLKAYKEEGIAFDGSEYILRYLEDNKYLLCNRFQCRHHGDYHIGNMILTNDNSLGIIDWSTIDFSNIGDPWYEFNRIDTRYTDFASGQINGYFDGVIPNEFWKLFAYYISASAITSIVWAKYYSPESMDEIMKKNFDVLEWFNDMSNPVPKWYRAL